MRNFAGRVSLPAARKSPSAAEKDRNLPECRWRMTIGLEGLPTVWPVLLSENMVMQTKLTTSNPTVAAFRAIFVPATSHAADADMRFFAADETAAGARRARPEAPRSAPRSWLRVDSGSRVCSLTCTPFV